MHMSDDKASEPEMRRVEVRLEGAGAAAPTKRNGQGITVTRNGVGDYTLTLAEHLGKHIGAAAVSLEGTPANLKNCSVILGTYVPATRTIQVTVWSSAGAARELAATEFVNATLRFKQTTAGNG